MAHWEAVLHPLPAFFLVPAVGPPWADTSLPHPFSWVGNVLTPCFPFLGFCPLGGQQLLGVLFVPFLPFVHPTLNTAP